ncbi:MAG: hypothetical protein HY657_16115 [Acidobacteria bacterium]|nr:hypothetical protein [Acidobacteriota bacterium]
MRGRPARVRYPQIRGAVRRFGGSYGVRPLGTKVARLVAWALTVLRA